MTVISYGSWPSPITAESLVAGASTPVDVRMSGGRTWWLEVRPEEGGRYQIVRLDADGSWHEVLPPGWSARTRVHEYGGGSWWVHGHTVYFTAWSDQRLYRVDLDGEPVAITPSPTQQHALRYADGTSTPDGEWVICVRESHPEPDVPADVVNEVVALRADGTGAPVVLASGRDFYASPRISRDGRQLAFVCWDHPNMPWDDTELWVGHLHDDGGALVLDQAARVAGGPGESVMQPAWGRHGSLFVISDRTDWWNVHRVAGRDALEPMWPVSADVGGPAWVFAESAYAIDDDGTLVLTYGHDGLARVAVVPEDGSPHAHELPYASLEHLGVTDGHVTCIASAYDHEPIVIRFPVAAPTQVEVLRAPRDLGLAPGHIARPEPIAFTTTGGATAHAWFYPPTNDEVDGPDDERPPLIVMSHGGPTAAAHTSFRAGIQFWTTRGFAVVDVDYGGSTGYGRAYRKRLELAWGVVDVDDCCAAARHLADHGRVDPARLAIRGGSAGGFTTLSALALHDLFAAGASMFGVADLGALARDTHKFESRYLDGLVGPWPEAEATYVERSPISHVDGFSAPLIVFQGLEDAVVPPNQSEMIVAALAAKGIPHAYLTFEGEQHGFRQASSIVRSLQAELSFYGAVFGVRPADDLPPLAIEFADRLGR